LLSSNISPTATCAYNIVNFGLY